MDVVVDGGVADVIAVVDGGVAAITDAVPDDIVSEVTVADDGIADVPDVVPEVIAAGVADVIVDDFLLLARGSNAGADFLLKRNRYA